MTTNLSASLEAMGDEMTFIQSIRAEQFEHVDFTFFASDPRATPRSGGSHAISATPSSISLGALEERAGRDHPLALDRTRNVGRGTRVLPNCSPARVVVAHPAAIALALLALRAKKSARSNA